jgi:hypothetical protein
MIPLDEDLDDELVPSYLLDPVVDESEFKRRALDAEMRHLAPLLKPRQDLRPTPLQADPTLTELVSDLVDDISQATVASGEDRKHNDDNPRRSLRSNPTPSAQAMRNIAEGEPSAPPSAISLAPAGVMANLAISSNFDIDPNVMGVLQVSQLPPNVGTM